MLMKRLLAPLFVLALAAIPAYAKINVVVTTPDLASIAQAVGGKAVAITTLTRPTEDPHFVDARPSFIVKLNRADALIEGGALLEIGWLPPLMEGARNAKIEAGAPGRILANEGIEMLEVPSTLDRSKGDIHAAGNPHFVVDPANAIIIARHFADAFAKLDAHNAATYQANAKAFIDELSAKLVEWQKLLAPYKGTSLVAYHNTWVYFARRFGLVIDTFLEPKPGIPPTPAHLAEVITKMKAQKIRAIIVEPYQNRRTAETVAADTGATVLDFTQFPGGVKGTDGGYIPMMDYLVNTLAKVLAADASKP